jgi:hypothetical protein
VERGDPISYMVLAKGTPVESSDGQQVGSVKRVLQVPEKDVFDGIIVRTPSGDRFADADDIGQIYENAVVLKLEGDAAARLPKPGPSAGTISASPDDVADSNLRYGARKLWNRFLGR